MVAGQLSYQFIVAVYGFVLFPNVSKLSLMYLIFIEFKTIAGSCNYHVQTRCCIVISVQESFSRGHIDQSSRILIKNVKS